MLSCEFHCHTIYSKDSLLRVSDLLKECDKKGIQRLAITDHNTIAGALAAKNIDPERVIIGEEIMTSKGELLAYFVKDELQPFLSPQETIRQLRDQGAFIGVSHPFDRYRKGGWKLQDLLEITPQIDALEIFNSRCLQPGFNRAAADFAATHHLLGIVGSDAHYRGEVGASRMALSAFHDPESLKEALQHAKHVTALSPAWVHLYSTYAKMLKRMFKLFKGS